MIGLWDIVGQDAAVGLLQRSLTGDRQPHAYLFAGPVGVGRRTTAIALGAALLCEGPRSQPNSGRFNDLPADQEIRQALKIADYVYVLDLGRNKFDGPVEEFTDLEKAFWA